MSSVKSHSDTEMTPKEHLDSSSNDEGSWSGSPATDGGMVLKKGPWTAAEDAILRDFVKKYGEGNWNAVQRNSGLLRCGKSCRLRWANHLRPELKKVSFTLEEERFIIDTHAKIGNKWARMASQLPGRTDNEIKNYWNTRTKRRHRAGLPLYPHDNSGPRATRVNHPSQIASQICSDDREGNGVQQRHLLCDIPEFQFNSCKPTMSPVSYAQFSDIRSTSMLSQCLGPCPYSLGVNRKRTREESKAAFPAYHVSTAVSFSTFKEPLSAHSDSIYRNLGLDYPNNIELDSISDAGPISHSLSNGNNSAYSHLPGAVKPELPSFQYPETNYSNWFTIDPIDYHSPQKVSFLPEFASPRSSGLLETLVHQSRAISTGQKLSSEKSSCSSAISDPIDSTALNYGTAEWEECSDHRSDVSLINGSQETVPLVEQLQDSPHWFDLSRPDVLFDSDWFLRSSLGAEEVSATSESFVALLGEGPGEKHECGFVPADVHGPDWALSMASLDSCPWNSMPSARQMPEHR